MSNIKVINNIKEFESMAGLWDELLKQSSSNHVFLTHEWIKNWWNIFSTNHKLLILLYYDQEELIGIAPFYLKKFKALKIFPMNQIRFLGDRYVGSDFLDFIIKKGHENTVIHSFIEFLSKEYSIKQFYLDDILSSSLSIMVLSEIAQMKKNASLSIFKKMPCPMIRLPKTFEEFLKQPNTTFKKITLNRNLKKLDKEHKILIAYFNKKDGTLENIFPILSGFKPVKEEKNMNTNFERLAIDLLMSKLFDLHMERWIGTPVVGIFQNQLIRLFYKNVSLALYDKNWLNLSFIIVDQHIEAIEFGLIYDQLYYSLQSGCSKRGLKLKAGNVLSSKIFEKMIPSIDEFHYLRGAEAYKYQWGAEDLYTVTIRFNFGFINKLRSSLSLQYVHFKWIIKRIIRKQ